MKKGYIVVEDSRTFYCFESEDTLSFRLGGFKNRGTITHLVSGYVVADNGYKARIVFTDKNEAYMFFPLDYSGRKIKGNFTSFEDLKEKLPNLALPKAGDLF